MDWNHTISNWIKRKLIQFCILALSPSVLVAAVWIETGAYVQLFIHLPPQKTPFDVVEPIIEAPEAPFDPDWDQDWYYCEPDYNDQRLI